MPCWWLFLTNLSVHTNLEDPVDVRNDPQKGIHAKAFSSSNLFVGFELLFSVSFEQTASVPVLTILGLFEGPKGIRY